MAPTYPRDVPPTRPNRPAVAYRVTGQQRSFGLDAQGRPTPGVDVQFETAGGVQGSVFVADSRFNAPNVQAAIAQRVAEHDAVGALTS